MVRILLMVIFLLLPHISFPGLNRYPIRPADFIIFVVIILTSFKIHKFKTKNHLANATLLIFFLSTASILWGYGYLTFHNADSILVDNEIVFYLPIAIRKVFLLFICLSAFHLVVHTRQADNKTLLQYWFYGLIFACLAHIVTYLIDLPLLMRRAGVFDEGNFGGAYYVLSFFLMWIAFREKFYFGRLGMAASFLGILLSQSSSALVIIFVLLFIYVISVSLVSKVQRSRNIGALVLILVVGLTVVLVFGEELTDKLFSEDITTNSFSRYDRLSSIFSGLSMFSSSPLFGVGIQGFSFALLDHSNEFLEKYFDYNSQRIVNNIYVQLIAEQGILGISAMIYFLYIIIRPAFLSVVKNDLVLLGFASILLSWLAFPSYTNTFHWLGFALLFRISRSNTLNTQNVTKHY